MPSRRPLLKLALLAAAGCTASAQAQTPPASERNARPPPPVGSRLPLPDLTLLDGSSLRAADLAGQVVVLYWWASWSISGDCTAQKGHQLEIGRAHV